MCSSWNWNCTLYSRRRRRHRTAPPALAPRLPATTTRRYLLLPDFQIVCYFSSFTYAAGSKRALLLNHLLFSPTNCFAIFPQAGGGSRECSRYTCSEVSNPTYIQLCRYPYGPLINALLSHEQLTFESTYLFSTQINF